MTRRLRFIAAFLAATMVPVQAAAQTPAQLVDLDLEDLLRINVQRVFGASERLQPVTEAPSSVTIVTAEEINRYGYRTLAEILGSVRGFFVTNDRNYSYLGARGFGRPGDYNARVLLLVNGHKTNDNVFDQAYIGAELGIDVAMFERVEIIRGPASSLYGTSAFFAVVNVVTRSGASLNGASLEADAGTLGSQLGRGSFGRQYANGADVAASATFERSSGVGSLYFPAFDAPGTNQGIAEDLDGEQVGEMYGRFKLRDFNVTGTYGRRKKLVPTASFSTLFNSQSPREQTIDEHTMIDAQYERMAGRARVSADLFFDRARYDAVYPYAGERDDMPVLINSDGFIGSRWGAGMHATRPLPGRQTLTAGGEFVANITQNQWTAYNDPQVDGFSIEQSSRQGAIYLQDEIRVQPWLLLNGGVRYDRYQRFARTTPRGAVIVMPSSNQSFKYLYGRAFRAPNMYELYYYDDATSYLQPESIDTHEVVWEQYVGEWLRTSLSGYRYTATPTNHGRCRRSGRRVRVRVLQRRHAARERVRGGGRGPLQARPPGARQLFAAARRRSNERHADQLAAPDGQAASQRAGAVPLDRRGRGPVPRAAAYACRYHSGGGDGRERDAHHAREQRVRAGRIGTKPVRCAVCRSGVGRARRRRDSAERQDGTHRHPLEVLDPVTADSAGLERQKGHRYCACRSIVRNEPAIVSALRTASSASDY